METRSVGRSGLQVPRLGLGCANFGREIDQATSFALMDYAVERGITLFDTAEAYGGGQARRYRAATFGVDDVREVSDELHSSEKIIGRWLRSTGARNKVVLVSKVTTDFTNPHMRDAIAASLERLQTDYLDVYMLHNYDPMTPLAEAAKSMRELKTSGLIRSAGCSNFTAEQLQQTAEPGSADPHFEFAQNICNLVARQVETDVLPLCRQLKMGFLAYSPLGAGFLTGKYSGDLHNLPQGSRFHVIPGHASIYFERDNFHTLQLLNTAAATLGIPPLCLAIAWVLSHPDVTTVLCGARSTAHLDNALDAYRLRRDIDWPPALRPVIPAT